MELKKQPPLGKKIAIALVVFGVLLIVLFVFLVRDYLALRRANLINRRELSLSAFVQKHGPLGASEVGVIRPWMTFDYINRLFNLPKDYLKNQLQISDSHYPNLTLGSYASADKVATVEAVNNVESAISNHFNQSAL
jgi:hypothetical protein